MPHTSTHTPRLKSNVYIYIYIWLKKGLTMVVAGQNMQMSSKKATTLCGATLNLTFVQPL